MNWRIVMVTSEECESEALAKATFSICKANLPPDTKAFLQRRQDQIGQDVPLGSWITVAATTDQPGERS